MKKLFYFTSLLLIKTAMAAPDSTVLNSVVSKVLNDTANKYWVTQQIVGPTVGALNLIDSTTKVMQRWVYLGEKGAYKLSKTIVDNSAALQVDFSNNTKSNNYEEFKINWATVIKKDSTSNLYGYTASGTKGNVIYSPKACDTMYSALVDLSKNPVVQLIAKSNKKVVVRLDLIDVNGRQSNAYAPHHVLAGDNQWHTIVFRWDERGPNADNPLYNQQGISLDYNVGSAIDGWSSHFFGIQQGRNDTLKPFLFGKTDIRGGIVLDLAKIASIALYFDDSDLAIQNTLDTAKTVTIKQITVGGNGIPVNVADYITKEQIENNILSKISFNSHNYNIKIQNTTNLSELLTIQKIKTLGYSSSNSNIVQVDEKGIMTGLKNGQAYVLAYDKDQPSVHDSVWINVYNKSIGFVNDTNEIYRHTSINLSNYAQVVTGTQVVYAIKNTENNLVQLSDAVLSSTKSTSAMIYIINKNNNEEKDSATFEFILNIPQTATVINSTKIGVSCTENAALFLNIEKAFKIKEIDSLNSAKVTSVTKEGDFLILNLDKPLQQTSNFKIEYTHPHFLYESPVTVFVFGTPFSFILPRFVLFENETINLNMCINGPKSFDYNFTSSQNNIAKIDSLGNIKGIKYGSTKAIAINKANIWQKDSSTILVLPNIIIVGVQIDGSGTLLEVFVNGDYPLYEGIEKDFIISVQEKTKTGSNYTITRVMKSADKPNVLLLQLDKPISVANEISLSYAPLSALDGTSKIRSTFSVNTTTNENETTEDAVKIYPNPAQASIRIQANNLQTLVLYNAQGSLMCRYETHNAAIEISIEHLPAGLYVAELITKSKTIKKTIIKQ